MPDDKVPSNIGTYLARAYFDTNHLWQVKAEYCSRKFGLPKAIASFFSQLSPAELLKTNEPPWTFLTEGERNLVLQVAVALGAKLLVEKLLDNPLFSELDPENKYGLEGEKIVLRLR
jgi:hypothetical protein